MTPKVLIVDDVDANLLTLEAALGQLDCTTIRAHSGNEALKLLLKHDFAVALLDVQMAEMDGFEVARLARSNPQTSEVPIIFITAMHESETNTLRGYGAGAVDFLYKPFNSEILRSKVRVFLDLSVSRRQLADEMVAHKATLKELDAFNYSVSHDLQAPLRHIAGLSAALREDCASMLDETGLRYLSLICDSVDRMTQLVADLLQLSAMTRAELNVAPVDLQAIADSIIAELRRTDPSRDVEYVSVAVAPVQGDARLLRIVLENLLRNAWKFTRKVMAPRIQFGLQTESDSETRTVWVKDNGAGFDSAYAQRLFQPFQRLHAMSDFEGTGIGLAIVQRIMQRHGGWVWAESEVDRGATFFLRLPAAK